MTWDLLIRMYGYPSPPFSLSEAFKRAQFEESIISLEELTRQIKADKVFEKMSHPISIDTAENQGSEDDNFQLQLKTNEQHGKILNSWSEPENEGENAKDVSNRVLQTCQIVISEGDEMEKFPSAKIRGLGIVHHLFDEMPSPPSIELNEENVEANDSGSKADCSTNMEVFNQIILKKGITPLLDVLENEACKLFDKIPVSTPDMNTPRLASARTTELTKCKCKNPTLLTDNDVVFHFDPGGCTLFQMDGESFELLEEQEGLSLDFGLTPNVADKLIKTASHEPCIMNGYGCGVVIKNYGNDAEVGQVCDKRTPTSVYSGLYVCDVSWITCSVGVYPCLPITTAVEHVSKNGLVTASEFNGFLSEYLKDVDEDLVYGVLGFADGFLPKVENAQVRAWAVEVHSLWKNLSRKVSEMVKEPIISSSSLVMWPVQVKIRTMLSTFLNKILHMVELVEWVKKVGKAWAGLAIWDWFGNYLHTYVWDPGQYIIHYILEDKDVLERMGKRILPMDITWVIMKVTKFNGAESDAIILVHLKENIVKDQKLGADYEDAYIVEALNFNSDVSEVDIAKDKRSRKHVHLKPCNTTFLVGKILLFDPGGKWQCKVDMGKGQRPVLHQRFATSSPQDNNIDFKKEKHRKVSRAFHRVIEVCVCHQRFYSAEKWCCVLFPLLKPLAFVSDSAMVDIGSVWAVRMVDVSTYMINMPTMVVLDDLSVDVYAFKGIAHSSQTWKPVTSIRRVHLFQCSFFNVAAPNGPFGVGFENIFVPSIISHEDCMANSFFMCVGHDGRRIFSFDDTGLLPRQIRKSFGQMNVEHVEDKKMELQEMVKMFQQGNIATNLENFVWDPGHYML